MFGILLFHNAGRKLLVCSIGSLKGESLRAFNSVCSASGGKRHALTNSVRAGGVELGQRTSEEDRAEIVGQLRERADARDLLSVDAIESANRAK